MIKYFLVIVCVFGFSFSHIMAQDIVVIKNEAALYKEIDGDEIQKLGFLDVVSRIDKDIIRGFVKVKTSDNIVGWVQSKSTTVNAVYWREFFIDKTVFVKIPYGFAKCYNKVVKDINDNIVFSQKLLTFKKHV